MPHNLYLHSSIVQTRKYERHGRGQARGDPVRDHRLDGRADVGAVHQRARSSSWRRRPSTAPGYEDVADIEDAYQLLTPLLGTTLAQHAVRAGAAGLGAELDAHRHAGRADRDGGLPQHPPAAVAAAPDHARCIAIVPALVTVVLYGETRHGAPARPQPGGPEPAAAVRGVPARDVHRRPRRRWGSRRPAAGCAWLAWPVAVVIAVLNVWLLVPDRGAVEWL